MSKYNNIEQITSFNTPQESPGYLLWRVSVAWRSSIEGILKPLDLTHPQFVVLAITAWLTKNGNHINQIDISKASGLDPNTTSQVLRGLEVKKYIKRIQALNERSKNPIVTDVGFNILNKALPAVETADSKFFALLSVKEIDALIKIFQKISESNSR